MNPRQWQLGPLQRQRAADLEAASAVLVRAQERVVEAERQLRALGDERGSACRTGLAAHAAAVRYHAGLAARIVQAAAQRDRCLRELQAARALCLGRRQDVEMLQALQRRTEQAARELQRRREAKEADLAWLVRVQP